MRLFTADDAYLVRMAGDVRLSPDGKRVTWVQTEMDRESDRPQMSIWVAPADGSTEPRRFTSGPRDVSPRWSPDGRWLSYVSAAEEGVPAQLYLAPLDGGVPQKVTDLPSSVSQPVWSPDGSKVAFVSATGTPKPVKERSPVEKAAPRVVRGLFARQDNLGWFDGRRHVFVLDVASGDVRQITDGDWDDDQPSWSPDGELIAFSSDRDRKRNDRFGRADAWVVRSDGKGKPRRITSGAGRASFPQFSPDGKLVAFIGHEAGDDFWDRDPKLYVTDAAGDGPPREIGGDLDRPMGFSFLPVSPYAWTPEGQILVLVADAGRLSIARVKPAGGRSKIVVAPDEGLIDGFSLGVDGKRIAHSHMSAIEPSEVYVRSLSGTGAPVRVSAANDRLRSEVRLGSLERRTITSEDGTEVEYFVVYPPQRRKGQPLPVHLEIHGGPHGFHPMGTHLPYLQALAGAGIAVLLPNPRGSSSYGQAFTEGCTGDWGGGDYDDLMACVDDLVERGVADPKKLTVGGYSYGGFMTSWVIGHTARFKAAVVGAPVVDQLSMLGTSDIPGFVVFAEGGLPWDRPDEYAKRSPLTYLQDARTPVLIQHWEGDLRCPIGQSEELYTALKLLGKKVEFVRYPGGSHISRSPSQAVDRTQRVIDWISSAG